MKEKIKVGDYVEPNCDEIANYVPLDDLSYEELFGYVIDKHNTEITIESIGTKNISSWNEKFFSVAEVPEIFKDEKLTRIKK